MLAMRNQVAMLGFPMWQRTTDSLEELWAVSTESQQQQQKMEALSPATARNRILLMTTGTGKQILPHLNLQMGNPEYRLSECPTKLCLDS